MLRLSPVILLLLASSALAQNAAQKKPAPGAIGIPSEKPAGPQLGGTGLFTTGPAIGPLGAGTPPVGSPRSVPPENFPGIANNPGSVGTVGGVPGQKK
jgi:hypothetical protein